MSKTTQPARTPNDQRSDVKNPNNQEHAADRGNRAAQAKPGATPEKKAPNDVPARRKSDQ